MTQLSYPWGGIAVGDATLAPYDDDAWSDIWRKLFSRDRTSEGILDDYASELLVTNPSGDTIRVASGAALVDGKFYENTANVDTLVAIDGTYRAVLQKDWTAQTVRISIESGGIASLVQNDGVLWETMLAEITRTGGVFNLTDYRSKLHFTTNVNTAMIDSLAVTTPKIANDAIDDLKAGDRIGQFYRRQGGSATDWSDGGSNNYTPGAVRLQFGVVEINIGIGSVSASVAVTFPVSFSNAPLVVCSVMAIPSGTSGVAVAYASSHLALLTGVTIFATRTDPADTTQAQIALVAWIAIGPE